MASITIDGVDYNLDDLSASAKEQLASLQFAQSEVSRLEALLAICKTAASAYSQALKTELNN